MDVLEAIFTRRSIRKYTDKPVGEDPVQTLLRAGMQAPSAHNAQPWDFIVLTDRKILKCIQSFHPYSKMLKKAALAILVCGNTALENSSAYVNQDCAAATQNILLAAHGLGLGAVWLGIYPREERVAGMRQLLKIPEAIIPVSLISLGYPEEAKEKTDRFRPERVHFNGW